MMIKTEEWLKKVGIVLTAAGVVFSVLTENWFAFSGWLTACLLQVNCYLQGYGYMLTLPSMLEALSDWRFHRWQRKQRMMK